MIQTCLVAQTEQLGPQSIDTLWISELPGDMKKCLLGSKWTNLRYLRIRTYWAAQGSPVHVNDLLYEPILLRLASLLLEPMVTSKQSLPPTLSLGENSHNPRISLFRRSKKNPNSLRKKSLVIRPGPSPNTDGAPAFPCCQTRADTKKLRLHPINRDRKSDPP